MASDVCWDAGHHITESAGAKYSTEALVWLLATGHWHPGWMQHAMAQSPGRCQAARLSSVASPQTRVYRTVCPYRSCNSRPFDRPRLGTPAKRMPAHALAQHAICMMHITTSYSVTQSVPKSPCQAFKSWQPMLLCERNKQTLGTKSQIKRHALLP